MKQSLFIFLAVSISLGLSYFTFRHPSLQERARLTSELGELQAQNERLSAENGRLERQIVALRDDPRQAERRAREVAALARPDEIVFQFEEPKEAPVVSVKLEVSPQAIKLAGRPVERDALGAALIALKAQLPHAVVELVFDQEIPPAERAQVEALLDAALTDQAASAPR
jgi:cell division protein FtsB